MILLPSNLLSVTIERYWVQKGWEHAETRHNIYKRKDGRWEARYIKGIKADGKKLYGSVYGKTYAEAKDKQAKFIIERSSPKQSEKITLSELTHEWLGSIENSVKKTTYQKYRSIIKNYRNFIIIVGVDGHAAVFKFAG